MKAVEFLGASLDDLRQFPPAARRAMGYQIDRVQNGHDADDWKPLPSVGPGVREIRVRDTMGAWRTIYIAKLPDAVYVLHCFQKKTQKTAQADVALAKARLADLMAQRPRSKS